jgi:hypothetical protein
MKRISFGLLILLLPALLAAQGKASPAPGQKLVLEFVDGTDLKATLANKSVLTFGTGIQEGDSVPAGATIVTGADTTAELKLRPNGSIIKLAKSTSFTVAALAGAPGEKNAFALLAGKVRAVAAKGAQYQFSSQTAVCAVRGTDFAFAVDEGAKALLMVADGLVQFDKIDSAGSVLGTIPVAAGEAADAFADTFASFKYSPEQYAEQFDDVKFQHLHESDVPKQAGQSEAPAAGESTASPAPASAQAAAESGFVKWLRENLGFEIGSIDIDGTNYSEAIIQPNFNLGKARLGLYLPVIYTSNLFDSSSWYRPDGNNEWTFGTDYFSRKDYLDGAKYLGIDLALKIKYFEYGTQYKDPFFIKAGNLEDMTLGHGLIMDDYANDTDFPSVRRLGFDMGLDGKGGGFELVANDLADPQIFGGRIFVRPVPNFRLALGLSAVVDWAPASVDPTILPDNSSDALKIIETGLDLDLPIIQSTLLGIRAYADGAVTMPYTTEAIRGVAQGFQTQFVYNSTTGQIQNWGAAGGLLGNVSFIDWRLEYRYITGDFIPSLFDGTYDRMRGQYAEQYLSYLANPGSYSNAPTIMGIFGKAGVRLFNDKLEFSAGYFWPWSQDASTSFQTQIVQSSDDLQVRLTIKKGLIPVIDLAGAITYEKRGLAYSIANKDFSLLDGNSVFGGEIDIPVPRTPDMDLAVIFQTEPVMDGNGNIIYATDSNLPELKPSISIEVRFHF